MTYSIGNQTLQGRLPVGTARYTANALNTMLAAITGPGSLRAEAEARDSKGINTLMANTGGTMNTIAATDLTAERAAEAYFLGAPHATGPKLVPELPRRSTSMATYEQNQTAGELGFLPAHRPFHRVGLTGFEPATP